MSDSDSSRDQARRTIDCEQVFPAYRTKRADLDRRFSGAMSWKAVAELVASLVGTRLPHLLVADPALAALPQALRDRAPALAPDAVATATRRVKLEPDW